MLPSIIVKEE